MILIAVALFGALSYTVAQMIRTGDPNSIGNQQASIYADEVLAMARQFREAVQTVRISNGCVDEDISFENSVVAGYTNGTNTRCQIFNASGGGLSFIAPSADVSSSNWTFSPNSILDIGSSEAELIVVLPLNLTAMKICAALNDKLSVANVADAPPVENFSFGTLFTGNYAGGTGAGAIIGNQSANFVGKPSGCAQDSTGAPHFYQTLIAR